MAFTEAITGHGSEDEHNDSKATATLGLPPPIIGIETSAIERLKEKKEPSLGELNPLLFPPNLTNPEAVAALKLVTTRKIEKYHGLPPTMLEPGFVITSMGPVPRLITKFEVEVLSEQQITLLEQLVRQTYGTAVRTRTNTEGNPVVPTSYPELEQKRPRRSGVVQSEGGKLVGWYFGPNTANIESSHMGLFVYRDLGNAGMARYLRGHNAKEWFLREGLVDPITSNPLKTSYLVEIREAGLYQTDIVEFATQVSSVLGTENLLEHRQLLYEIYNDLNRLGLKKKGKDAIYGLDAEIDRIERVLILPLANLDLSLGIDFHPGSALLVGVPGTGKTLLAEYFLQQDTGVFLLPLDPLHLAQELSAPPEKKRILPRISEVFNQTNIPIVLHIDDVENIAANEDDVKLINSSLLNLMAGVRASGFFVLASTNHPEKLNPQLLEPQRFAHVVYTGLPQEQARYGILDVHATRVSRELCLPLFSSDQERQAILTSLATQAKDFTPRFLAEICTEAKSFYLQRIARIRERSVGLTEEDIDQTFTIEDWVQGFAEAEKKYDKETVVKRDKELAEFAIHYYRRLGFPTPGDSRLIPLQRIIEERIAALLGKTTETPRLGQS